MTRPVDTPPAIGRPSQTRLAVLNRASGVGLRVLPRIPNAVKRLLLGGRRVVVDGNTLDTTLQLMLTLQKASGLGGLVASDDVAVARDQLRALAGFIDAPVVVDTAEVTVDGAAGTLRARHYICPSSSRAGRPDGAPGTPLLVYYHGGGFAVGDIATHDALCRLLCRDADVHVLSVEYRRAPEHRAPAAVDDAYAAYRWAVEHAAELGADPQRIAVGGDSAGGNLAAVVALLARDDRIHPPALQLLLYPVVYSFHGDTRSKALFSEGFFLTKRDMDWFETMYLDGASIGSADPRISPLLAEDLTGLPPAIVVTAGFDPLRDEGDRYAEALAAAGVAVDHRRFGTLVHGFANFFPLGGDSANATADVVSAVRAHLSRA